MIILQYKGLSPLCSHVTGHGNCTYSEGHMISIFIVSDYRHCTSSNSLQCIMGYSGFCKYGYTSSVSN